MRAVLVALYRTRSILAGISDVIRCPSGRALFRLPGTILLIGLYISGQILLAGLCIHRPCSLAVVLSSENDMRLLPI